MLNKQRTKNQAEDKKIKGFIDMLWEGGVL